MPLISQPVGLTAPMGEAFGAFFGHRRRARHCRDAGYVRRGTKGCGAMRASRPTRFPRVQRRDEQFIAEAEHLSRPTRFPRVQRLGEQFIAEAEHLSRPTRFPRVQRMPLISQPVGLTDVSLRLGHAAADCRVMLPEKGGARRPTLNKLTIVIARTYCYNYCAIECVPSASGPLRAPLKEGIG